MPINIPGKKGILCNQLQQYKKTYAGTNIKIQYGVVNSNITSNHAGNLS